jgi:hypothetical protein
LACFSYVRLPARVPIDRDHNARQPFHVLKAFAPRGAIFHSFGFTAEPHRSLENVTMRTEFLDDIGDAIFAIAMAAGIGLAAANLAIQVAQERAALDTASRDRGTVSTTTAEQGQPLDRGSSDQHGTNGVIGF